MHCACSAAYPLGCFGRANVQNYGVTAKKEQKKGERREEKEGKEGRVSQTHAHPAPCSPCENLHGCVLQGRDDDQICVNLRAEAAPFNSKKHGRSHVISGRVGRAPEPPGRRMALLLHQQLHWKGKHSPRSRTSSIARSNRASV